MTYSQGPVFPCTRHFAFLVLVLLVGTEAANPALGQSVPQHVLPAGSLPNDRRLGALKDLNGHFPFEVPGYTEEKTTMKRADVKGATNLLTSQRTALQAWEARKDSLKRRILVATGLWPMPPKTPLHSVIRGKIERDGFTIEKVHFESLPGHLVTGLLFRPKGKQSPCPGVLSP
ncbi:unnamed protein product, partial [marine sediment metagenome]